METHTFKKKKTLSNIAQKFFYALMKLAFQTYIETELFRKSQRRDVRGHMTSSRQVKLPLHAGMEEKKDHFLEVIE